MAADSTRISSSRSPLPFMEIKNLDFKRGSGFYEIYARSMRDLFCGAWRYSEGRRAVRRWNRTALVQPERLVPSDRSTACRGVHGSPRTAIGGRRVKRGGSRQTEGAVRQPSRLRSAWRQHLAVKLRRLRGGGRLWPAGAAGRTRASQATGGRFDAPVRTPGGRRVRSSAMMSRSTRSAVSFGGPTFGSNLTILYSSTQ